MKQPFKGKIDNLPITDNQSIQKGGVAAKGYRSNVGPEDFLADQGSPIPYQVVFLFDPDQPLRCG
jgi:hypothetical protein